MLFTNTGWRGEDLVVAVAVTLGESAGAPRAYNGRDPDDSYGLLQVNMAGSLGPARRQRYKLASNEDLFDPATNATVAFDIYVGARNSFRPWGAYTNGSYKRHLSAAREGVANMARLVKSLQKLRAEVDALAPHRSKSSDGWIGDTAHSSRKSDHNPEWDGTVDAVDITHDPANGCDCHALVERIIASRDPRVKYLIFDYEIISGAQGPAPWVRRHYDGSNPHTKHMHISVHDAGQDDESPWFHEFEEDALAAVTREEWDAFTASVNAKLKDVTDAVNFGGTSIAGENIDRWLTAWRKEIDLRLSQIEAQLADA